MWEELCQQSLAWFLQKEILSALAYSSELLLLNYVKDYWHGSCIGFGAWFFRDQKKLSKER